MIKGKRKALYIGILALLVVVLAVVIFLNKAGYTDPGTINMWLGGAPNGYYYIDLDLSDNGNMDVYRHIYFEGHPYEDETLQKARENHLGHASMKLSKEQVNKLRKEIAKLVNNFDKRFPHDCSDGFDNCMVKYKGEWYDFHYREHDDFITRIIQISPIPIAGIHGGAPMIPYDILEHMEIEEWFEEKGIVWNK